MEVGDGVPSVAGREMIADMFACPLTREGKAGVRGEIGETSSESGRGTKQGVGAWSSDSGVSIMDVVGADVE